MLKLSRPKDEITVLKEKIQDLETENNQLREENIVTQSAVEELIAMVMGGENNG